MATSIKIDESSGLQNGSGTGDANDFAENQAVGGIVLTNGEPFPALFDAALAEVTLATGQSENPTVSLSGYSADNPNGLPVEITGFGGGVGVSDIGWTDASGDPLNGDVALDTDGNELLTTSGSRILLYTYTSISNNILLGYNEDTGDLVFAAYLDTLAADGITTVDDGTGDAGATSVKIWMVQYESIAHPDFNDPDDLLTLGNPLNVSVNSLIDFSLEGAPSGQNLFLMFGDGTPAEDEVAIVVTGKDPLNQSDSGDAITTMDTVNSSKGGGETTLGSNNQMIDPSEGMYFTFVMGANTDYTVPNLDQNEADVEANIDFDTFFGSTSASFVVVQLQPPKKATLMISTYNNTDGTETGTQFIDGLGDGDDTPVDITSVTIIRDVKVGKTVTTYTLTFFADGSPATSEPAGGPLSALEVTFLDNTVTIEGIVADDQVIYDTDGLHNRVLIDNIGNSDPNLNSSFDIGSFKLESGELVPNPFHQLGFVDDGPTAAATLAAGVVRHDETVGNDGDADDVTGPLAEFALVANISTDMTAAYAQGTASVIDSSASVGGADGLGTTTYSLAVFAAAVDSGLDTTEGQDILLYKEGDLVVGRISGGTDDGEAAFAVAIDSSTGVLSMVQYHSIKHPTGGASHDESISVGNGALFAVATVTDGDQDPDSAQVDIGANVRFQDDGPALSGVDDSTNALVYAAGTTQTDTFSFAPGVDGAASPGVTLIGYTDPDDSTDLAASGLDELEALYGVDITASQVGNTVTYYTPDGGDADADPDPLFTLAVTDSDWTFTIHQDPTLIFNVFDFSSFKAGGPVETIALEAGTGGTFGVFDGLLFGPLDAPDGTDSRGIFPPTPDNPGAASTDDDLNPDELGFGIRRDAASNMNNNEGFQLTFHEGSAGGALTTVEGVQFKIDQQGNTNDVVMSFELINGTQGDGDDPDVTAIEAGAGLWLDSAAGTPGTNDFSADDNGGFWVRMALPGGNNDVFFTILDSAWQDSYTPAANELVVYVDGAYDTAMYRMAYPKDGTYTTYGSQFKNPDTNPEQVNDSVRIKDITLIEVAPIPDLSLSFEVQGMDGDGDTTPAEVFSVFVSEDGSAV